MVRWRQISGLWVGLLLCALMGCNQDQSVRQVSASHPNGNYDEVMQELRNLREKSLELYHTSRQHAAALSNVDTVMSRYFETRELSFHNEAEFRTIFNTLTDRYTLALTAFGELEVLTEVMAPAMNAVGDQVLTPERKSDGRLYVDTMGHHQRSLRQYAFLRKTLQRDYESYMQEAAIKLGRPVKAPQRRKIPISREQRYAVELNLHHSLGMDEELYSMRLSSEEDVEDFTRQEGFSKETALFFRELSSSSGGYLFLTPENLPKAISDIMARMKHDMNEYRKDGELVLLFDKAATLSPHLQALSKNLVRVHLATQSILAAGADFRIGVATYGGDGSEVIVAPTNDFSLLQEAISKVTSQCTDSSPQARHFYAGTRTAVNLLKGVASERFVIIVTNRQPAEDESAEMRRQSLKMLRNAESPTVFTIQTK